MNFTPLSDRVLLSLLPRDERTPGGLFTPAIAADPVVKAEVVAVGPGKVLAGIGLVEPRVRVGDVVLVPENAGREVALQGKNCLVVSEAEILGVLTEGTLK